MTRRLKPLVVAALLTAAVACGDDGTTTPSFSSATGTWTGALGGVTVTVMLSEDGEGVVTGNGSFSGLEEPLEFTVEDGVHDHPDISFIARAEGYEDLMVDGTFTDDDTITATLTGSGFTGQTAILTRS